MKIVYVGVMSLFTLSACQLEQRHAPLNAQDLADRFVKPAGAEAVVGVIFNDKGGVIAVTANGEILKPCRLSDREDDVGKDSKKVTKPDLPVCDGVTNTSIYAITPVTVIQHKGSDCDTIGTIVDDLPVTTNYCRKHRVR